MKYNTIQFYKEYNIQRNKEKLNRKYKILLPYLKNMLRNKIYIIKNFYFI